MARTPHGHLVRIRLNLAGPRRSSATRASVLAYLKADDGFLPDFAALDPERRLLALQAVDAAFDRLAGREAPAPAERIPWARSPEWQDRIRDAARRLPDDRSIARELGISANAAKVARWRYAGRRDKPHVARIFSVDRAG